MIQKGSTTVDEEIVQQIVDTAGSNLLELNRLAECPDPMSVIEDLVQQQTIVLREMYKEQNEAYKLLLKVHKGEKIRVDHGDKRQLLLLSQRGNVKAICGVHPNRYLILSMPVTKKALQNIEREKAIAREEEIAKNAG